MSKTKLELTWIGKNERKKLEPRILLEDPSKSYHASQKVTENDIFDNKLIFGDNLLALKALEQDYAGQVKCVYIDPPFNTGSAFEHYDDGVEHSLWLSLMKDRLSIIYNLLKDDGCIFVHLDDNELDYLKVLMDEIFGRSNFLSRITIEARAPSAFSTVNKGVFKASEYILW
ncbi:site-specific DNA-methyltransferase, partial [Salmonella enterica subsp. enterica]|nr:site-specific DNA-methyltransferase [Salmonella enterica subsp. enterica serovar Schwarzengrund]